MASESSFTGFGDPPTEVIAVDLCVVSILSVVPSALVLRVQGLHHNLNFFTPEDEPLSDQDIFGQAPLAPPFSTSEYPPAFFPGIPPCKSPTPGVTQHLFHPLQTSSGTSILQPMTIVRDPLLPSV